MSIDYSCVSFLHCVEMWHSKTSGLALFWNQHNKSSRYNDSYLRDGSTFRLTCFSFLLTNFSTHLFQFSSCEDHYMSINYSYVSFRHHAETWCSNERHLSWNQHNKSSRYNDSYLRDGSTFRLACFSFVLVWIITCQSTICMSHSYIVSRYGVQMSSLCLGINTTKVGQYNDLYLRDGSTF